MKMPAKTPRAVRPPVPPMPEMEALDRTHREVMHTLNHIAKLIEHLDAHGADDEARGLAKRICAFFNGQAKQHHADEERLIFPELARSSDATLVQHVLRLQQDHGWLEEDWFELEPPLQAIAAGYNWYDLDMLRHALPVFEALYRDHIALEESLIYPEAKRRIAAAEAGAAQRATGAAPLSS